MAVAQPPNSGSVAQNFSQSHTWQTRQWRMGASVAIRPRTPLASGSTC